MSSRLQLQHKQLERALSKDEKAREMHATLLVEVAANPKVLLDTAKAAAIDVVIQADLEIVERLNALRGAAAAQQDDHLFATMAREPLLNDSAPRGADPEACSLWALLTRCFGHPIPDVITAALHCGTQIMKRLLHSVEQLDTTVQDAADVVASAISSGLFREASATISSLRTSDVCRKSGTTSPGAKATFEEAIGISLSVVDLIRTSLSLPLAQGPLASAILLLTELPNHLASPLSSDLRSKSSPSTSSFVDSGRVAEVILTCLDAVSEVMLVSHPNMIALLTSDQAGNVFLNLLGCALSANAELSLPLVGEGGAIGPAASEESPVLDVPEDFVDAVTLVARLFAELYPASTAEVSIGEQQQAMEANRHWDTSICTTAVSLMSTCLPRLPDGKSVPFISLSTAKRLVHQLRILGVTVAGSIMTTQPSLLIHLVDAGLLGVLAPLTKQLHGRSATKRTRTGTQLLSNDEGGDENQEGHHTTHAVELAIVITLWEQVISVSTALKNLVGSVGNTVNQRVKAKLGPGSNARLTLLAISQDETIVGKQTAQLAAKCVELAS